MRNGDQARQNSLTLALAALRENRLDDAKRLSRDLLAAARPDLKFAGDGVASPDVHLAYCPERVLPGRILEELVNNARVIGGLSRDAPPGGSPS